MIYLLGKSEPIWNYCGTRSLVSLACSISAFRIGKRGCLQRPNCHPEVRCGVRWWDAVCRSSIGMQEPGCDYCAAAPWPCDHFVSFHFSEHLFLYLQIKLDYLCVTKGQSRQQYLLIDLHLLWPACYFFKMYVLSVVCPPTPHFLSFFFIF